jgi:hypothetical protein
MSLKQMLVTSFTLAGGSLIIGICSGNPAILGISIGLSLFSVGLCFVISIKK